MIFIRRKLLWLFFVFICLMFLRIFYLNVIQDTEKIPVHFNSSRIISANGVKDITLMVHLPVHRKWENEVINVSTKILYVSDSYVVRSAKQPKPNTKFVINNVDLLDLHSSKDPLDHVDTNFILIVIDPPRHISDLDAKIMISSAKKYPKDIFIVPFKTKTHFSCMSIKLNLKQWTLEYNSRTDAEMCSAAKGIFGIFAKTSILRQFQTPWLQPFPEALFIEAAARRTNIRLMDHLTLTRGKFWGGEDSRKKILQRVEMYDKLRIKKVVQSGVVEWYGCTRNTTRCFGTIYDDTPDYLRQGRWTPPCCLRVLRETARHVFRSLEHHKVRYWLEGGSLLGAMRSGDIIPWDYDVDIGVYESDLDNVPYIRELKKLAIRGVKVPSVIDKHGYVWESSRPNEGRHFRVQASRTNRLHVDIFPFYPRNGNMTKDTWLPHKQDMEFPESFLKPLTKISFVGTSAFAPNNIRDFLEMKFGPGCIEFPQYPNPSLISYPSSVQASTPTQV